MKLLVGFNSSNMAKAALLRARTLAEALDATIIIVTSMGGGRIEKMKAIDKAAGELKLAEQLCKEKGIPCETHQLARGMSAGEDLISFAKENSVDLIFVGVKNKSKAQKMILGSTAQHVILKAPCPVVSVNRSSK